MEKYKFLIILIVIVLFFILYDLIRYFISIIMLFLDKYYKSKSQSNFKFSDNSIYKPGDEWKEIIPGQKIPSVN